MVKVLVVVVVVRVVTVVLRLVLRPKTVRGVCRFSMANVLRFGWGEGGEHRGANGRGTMRAKSQNPSSWASHGS